MRRLGSPGCATRGAGPQGWCFSWAGREGNICGFLSLWIQEFSSLEGRFLPFALCMCCGSTWSWTLWLQQQGLAFPRCWLSCPVLGHPGGTTGTLSGFGLSSALWGLLQWWQPLFGEVEDTMPCWWLYRTTLVVPGAATSLLVPRGKATSTLPQPCLGSVGAALGDTVTSHRSTCT